MKKTLITLLAFAGIASATSSDWTCDPTTIKDEEVVVSGTSVHTWDVSDTAGLTWTGGNAFSIAITLDVNSLAKTETGEFDTTKRYAVMSIRDYTSKPNKTTSYNGLACVAIQNGKVQFINWNGATAADTNVAEVSLSELGAQSSLTLVVNRDSSNTTTMGVYADGNFDNGRTLAGLANRSFDKQEFTELNFGGTTADSYTGGVNAVMPGNDVAAEFTLTGAAYMTGGVATADQLRTYYNLVPEPTTACLSLLALAGLAARRRRR